MHDERDDEDDEEQLVVAEVFEDVPFVWLELPCVDLVEYLQEDEGVEDDRVVKKLLGRVIESRWQTEVLQEDWVENAIIVTLSPLVDFDLGVIQLSGEERVEDFAYFALVTDAGLPVIIN